MLNIFTYLLLITSLLNQVHSEEDEPPCNKLLLKNLTLWCEGLYPKEIAERYQDKRVSVGAPYSIYEESTDQALIVIFGRKTRCDKLIPIDFVGSPASFMCTQEHLEMQSNGFYCINHHFQYLVDLAWSCTNNLHKVEWNYTYIRTAKCASISEKEPHRLCNKNVITLVSTGTARRYIVDPKDTKLYGILYAKSTWTNNVNDDHQKNMLKFLVVCAFVIYLLQEILR